MGVYSRGGAVTERESRYPIEYSSWASTNRIAADIDVLCKGFRVKESAKSMFGGLSTAEHNQDFRTNMRCDAWI
uniref:Conserved domain protein n=1 Tax=Steinernema glaseri TaxID=37863 RepID=A0A1I7Y6L0_9BILA